MTFVEAIKSGFKNMTKFEGRSTRSEYWWFFLFYVLCAIVANILGAILFHSDGTGMSGGGLALLCLVALAFLLPSLSLAFRRLHDTNRSGWWLLLALVPVGGLVLLIFYCLPGTPGPNKYGAGPFMTQIASTFE